MTAKRLRLRCRNGLEALRADRVEVAARGRADVAGDAVPAPAEIVGCGDVDEHVEPRLVAEVGAGLDDARGVDDQRRLAVLLARLDEPRSRLVPGAAHSATPRMLYAGGTPALIFSWRRTMPSISASGRGGQPGTWMSTGTILSTPWSTV